MHVVLVPKKHVLAVTIASLFVCAGATAQDASSEPEAAVVVVTGTRVANRTALDTTAPVDIISAETLKNSGTTELNQALSIALPSLNFPRPSLTDGTDTVRPAMLRGMAPDQSLVLVNSKRRHSSSLVNLNGSIGRGSAAVDMNTIPSAIVKNIEVLRDGAAAQYGSDAIAGVVNIRLRTDRSGGEGTVTYGARLTEYDLKNAKPENRTWPDGPSSRERTDGHTATVSAWKGLPLGETGYLTIAAEYKDQARTERGGYDMRPQYTADAPYDPRELTINRFNAWYGDPDMKQSTLFANAGSDLGGGARLYAWSSYQKREARSAGYFRRALDVRNITAIYPDGFLPIIAPTVDDFSATGGATWSIGAWEMDASLGYGRNKMQFEIQNTLNRSIGPGSKTEFDAGGFSYDQTVLNLTGVRSVAMDSLASPLNVAIGTEVRREGYKLFAGEPDSYRYGGQLQPGTTTPAAPGAQVFPGFRPSNQSDTSRTAVGAFVDVEANLTSQLLASFAVRAERYSDFGNSLAGKLAGRYDFSKQFALRASVQNGFRAPSPQQQNFTSTSTNFILGVPFEITTFKPTDPVARALGAQPLEAEKSVNASLGAVLRFDPVTVTIDAYRIDVRDRIVLSENLTQTNVFDYIASQGFVGVGGGRFFINGVDTTNEGIDVVVSMPYHAGSAGKFDFTVAANVNRAEVTKVPTTAQLSSLPTGTAPPLFDRVNVLTLEQGQPKNKLTATANWKLGRLGVTGRVTRYGKVLAPAPNALFDSVLGAQSVVDLEARYALTSKMNLAVGADNLLDAYPETLSPALNTTNNTPFSTYAPFGFSGRFVYARASYTF